MATVDATIDQIIANARDTADEQISLMNSKVDEAVNIAQTRFLNEDFPSDIDPNAPNTIILEPPSLSLDQLLDLDDPRSLEIKEDIDREFQGFLNDYYPDFSTLASTTVNWIIDTINNGGEALPNTEETKIWDRARSREDALNEQGTHEAIEAMARRGWAAPPGVLTERLRVAQKENTVRQSTLSRDIAIKQAELAHEMLKFAVQQAVALQSNVLQAAAQFVSEYVRASAIGLENSASLANAAVNLYQNTISYYRAVFEQEDLELRYAQASAEVQFKTAAEDFSNRRQRVENAANTAIEAARALGDSAAAALGAQNTMAATVQEITDDED